MQRYWDADTTPEEEMDLARFVARSDDKDFDGIRGMLGYLSIGRMKKKRRACLIRTYSIAAFAACMLAIAISGPSLGTTGADADKELCVRYICGEKDEDYERIMSSVESSLEGFFTVEPLAENKLRELFQR